MTDWALPRRNDEVHSTAAPPRCDVGRERRSGAGGRRRGDVASLRRSSPSSSSSHGLVVTGPRDVLVRGAARSSSRAGGAICEPERTRSCRVGGGVGWRGVDGRALPRASTLGRDERAVRPAHGHRGSWRLGEDEFAPARSANNGAPVCRIEISSTAMRSRATLGEADPEPQKPCTDRLFSPPRAAWARQAESPAALPAEG